jgi:ApeA N-terminal domain 1
MLLTCGGAIGQELMPTSLEERGFFWVPDNKDNVLSGLLTANEQDIRVDLDSTFQELDALLKLSGRYPEIHGVTLGGKQFSLFEAVQTGAHMSMRGPARETIWVRHCIIGAHLSKEAIFAQMDARLDHLSEWVARSGIVRDRTGTTRTVTYSSPDPIVATISDGELSLRFTSRFENDPHRAEITEQVWLVCRPQTAASLNVIADKLFFPARELISFATGIPSVVEEITVRVPDEIRGPDDPTDLQFFHRFIQPNESVRASDRANPSDMVFVLADWPGDFAGLINGWLQLKGRAPATLSGLFGLAFSPPRWGDTIAMIWAQAIETYHRDCFAGSLANEEAAERRARILSACPKDDRPWLEMKLEHADEPSLRRRIKDVARRAKPIVLPLLSKFPGLALHLSGARNAYAHFGIGTSERITAFDLDDLSKTARWVLTANLLLDLGFSETAARAVIERNSEYHHLAFEKSGAL